MFKPPRSAPRSARAQVNTLAAASPGVRESKSLALDGSTTYAQVPVNPAINVTGPFTAEAWVKFNNTTGVYQSIFERYGTPTARAATAASTSASNPTAGWSSPSCGASRRASACKAARP